jgi:D-arabinose 5-phosphate isomerase GutQ
MLNKRWISLLLCAALAALAFLPTTTAKAADIVLKMYVNRETDKYNCQGTTSNTMLNALFDALQAALIEETDYKNESFALVHPGGAVGERLNR